MQTADRLGEAGAIFHPYWRGNGFVKQHDARGLGFSRWRHRQTVSMASSRLHAGSDPHHDRRSDDLSAPPPGPPGPGIARAAQPFLPLLAVADHRPGHQGMGRHSPQAPRQMRHGRRSPQPRHPRHQESVFRRRRAVPRWIERNLYTKYSWQGVGILLVLNIVLFGVIGISIWAVQMLWIPIMAAGVINGIGHWWGYRNYDCADAATNIIPWGILIGGEELHNNHHTHATSAKLSSKWYEFDIGWLYIRILETFGLAKVRKIAPEPKFAKGKQIADFDTLQSVIANRYDVMAKYAKSVKHAWHEEVDHLRTKAALEKRFLKSSRKLMKRDPAKLEASHKQQLIELFEHSKALETMHHMRVELGAIWERSHFTRDQLLHQLQDWCARAEASGIKSLQEFSLRLRSYA